MWAPLISPSAAPRRSSTPAFGKKLAETDCVNCGQCAAVCPTAAIRIQTCHNSVWREIYNPKKRVVAQIAPAVRVAIGEAFGLKPCEDSIGRVFTAMRMMGFDAVFDTCLGRGPDHHGGSEELRKSWRGARLRKRQTAPTGRIPVAERPRKKPKPLPAEGFPSLCSPPAARPGSGTRKTSIRRCFLTFPPANPRWKCSAR